MNHFKHSKMWSEIVAAIFILFAISLPCAAAPFEAAQFDPITCAKYLKGDAKIDESGRPEIRGPIVSKIVENLNARIPGRVAKFKTEGVRFGHEDLVDGPAGDLVDFSQTSFRTMRQFFSYATVQEAVPAERVQALEARVMTEIGAIVYGSTAQSLIEIYKNDPSNKKVVKEAPFAFDSQNEIIDFRATSVLDLNSFISLVEEKASLYDNQRDLDRWTIKARRFLLESKERDHAGSPATSTTEPSSDNSAPDGILMGHPPGYVGHP